ncbi:hypothetical protein FEM48_Zijuj06G0005700 [Ziziphus jujuba var. spinosa]|uniref:Receptor ligand binding region domain-containing protein n=1 Tax=Ziziphus jujuba var. spinosa TaxID=714518 RepID=A0A978V654_ZIZJJ|nr:hypothetical protein FEM48_Zijuj06G0005700 [Ziziphus jujuba var. spinosa]
MNCICFLALLLFLYLGAFPIGHAKNVSSRPAVVNIGAIFTLNSTIGRVAKIAIEEAIKDVNSNSSVLPGTKLAVQIKNSNCNGFLGMVEALQFMETDVIAVLGPQSSVVAHIISHVANELQVPLLSFGATDPTLYSLQFPFFVRTTQSDLYQMTAVAEIVDNYGWREVITIYVDDDYGRNGVSALDDKLAERRCKISYKVGIPPGSGVKRGDILDILVKVALMESRVIVLHVNPDSGFMVFSVAQYLGMMGNGFVWITTDWLSSVLDSTSPLPMDTMKSMQGVLVLRQHSPDSDRKRAFISRWNKLTGGSLGLHSYGLYAYDSVWLLAHAIDAFFKQGGVISFSIDSRIRSAEGSGDLNLEAMSIFDDGLLLLENIMQSELVGLTGPLRFNSEKSLVLPAYDILNVIGTGIRQIGYWSNYSGLSTVPPETLYGRPPNRSAVNQKLYSVIWPGETLVKPRGWVFPNNGKQLRIGVPVRVSYRDFISQVQGTDLFKGFCVDVFTAAVNFLPYAVPYRFIPFGDGHENPSYTDLVNLITAGENTAFPRDSPLAVDMSTAILQLSENGDLQRIHDKWLMRSGCSLESAEIESDRLHLKSFWGLFLICGLACLTALLVYFVQILNQLRNAATTDSVLDPPTDSRSRRLRRILSIIDEKVDHNKEDGRNKRRKIERSLSESNNNSEVGRNPHRTETEITTRSGI